MSSLAVSPSSASSASPSSSQPVGDFRNRPLDRECRTKPNLGPRIRSQLKKYQSGGPGPGQHICGDYFPNASLQKVKTSILPEPVESSAARIKTETAAGRCDHQCGERMVFDFKSTHSLPGQLVRSEHSSRVADRAVNNVFDAFGITRDFFSTVFGRNSLDGLGIAIKGTVHFSTPASREGFNNAFWSSDINQLVFGDGDGQVFDNLTNSLDVSAHELAHGVIQHTANLEYSGEPGALNESISDVIACMVEQRQLRQTARDADWRIGHSIFPVAFRGRSLRSLKRPGTAYVDDPVLGTDPQPSHYSRRYTGLDDNGGVHINSGIPNHAFYLAAVNVGGYSWEKVGQVWYDALTSPHIRPDCTFSQFATLTINAAVKWGIRPEVAKAWADVGVYPTRNGLARCVPTWLYDVLVRFMWINWAVGMSVQVATMMTTRMLLVLLWLINRSGFGATVKPAVERLNKLLSQSVIST